MLQGQNQATFDTRLRLDVPGTEAGPVRMSAKEQSGLVISCPDLCWAPYLRIMETAEQIIELVSSRMRMSLVYHPLLIRALVRASKLGPRSVRRRFTSLEERTGDLGVSSCAVLNPQSADGFAGFRRVSSPVA